VTREPIKPTAVNAETLTVPERILLFCLASGTPWQKAGVAERTVSNMVTRGMVDRQPDTHLLLTRQGREALVALLDNKAA
jgi:hypothetical protein